MNCLNCNSIVEKEYCAHCGQRSSIKRFTLKGIFKHILYGLFNVDSGLLFTIKELFTRPGHAVREYLAGKRVRLFNPFSFLALSVTISLLFAEYSSFDAVGLVSDNSKEVMTYFMSFVNRYPMLFNLMLIPFYSIGTFLFFRKSKLNMAEHLVLNAYRAPVDTILGVFQSILSFINCR